MNEITKSITYLKEYKQLKQAVDEGKSPVLAVGLSAIHKAHLAAALGLDTGRPVLVLTPRTALPPTCAALPSVTLYSCPLVSW